MEQYEIEMAIDRIAEILLSEGLSADEIESHLIEEAHRVSQEIEDGEFDS